MQTFLLRGKELSVGLSMLTNRSGNCHSRESTLFTLAGAMFLEASNSTTTHVPKPRFGQLLGR